MAVFLKSIMSVLIDEKPRFDHDRGRNHLLENSMANEKGPNIKKKQKCKNCEGKGLLKKGDKVVKCQRCGGTGVR
jgi:DnaJ-class molecular chaperone